MLSTIRKGISSQIKAVGRSMDQLGAMIEPNPYHEKGKCETLNCNVTFINL